MTGTLILGIVCALAVFALMRFVAKQPWVVSILAAVAVLVSINIEWIKPALESVGTALGTMPQDRMASNARLITSGCSCTFSFMLK